MRIKELAMDKDKEARRFLHYNFKHDPDVELKDMIINRYLALCCLGIKETPERTGYYRRAIRALINSMYFPYGGKPINSKPSEKELDNILDYITKKAYCCSHHFHLWRRHLEISESNRRRNKGKQRYILM